MRSQNQCGSIVGFSTVADGVVVVFNYIIRVWIVSGDMFVELVYSLVYLYTHSVIRIDYIYKLLFLSVFFSFSIFTSYPSI